MQPVEGRVSLLAPVPVALLSVGLFLVAFFFAPGAYSEMMQEPNYMFLNWKMLLYFLACFTGYVAGVWWVSASNTLEAVQEPEGHGAIYLLVPLIATNVMLLGYLAVMSTRLNLLALITSFQGELIKLAIRSGSSERTAFDSAQPFACVLIVWLMYRLPSIEATERVRAALKVGVYWTVGLLLVIGLLMVERQTVLFTILAVLVIHLCQREQDGRMSLKSVLGFGAIGIVVLLGGFLLAATLRGSSSSNGMLTVLMGYTIASYNRLAALLNGVLYYDVRHSGVFLVQYLSEGQALNNVIPFREFFGWPDPALLFEIEFVGVARAGLNLRFNWSSLFGYLYSDLEWWSPVFMAGMGAITAFIWNSFRKGRCMGICLYVWTIYSILFWVGGNLLFTARFVAQIEMAVLLVLYQKLDIGSLGENASSKSIERSSSEVAHA